MTKLEQAAREFARAEAWSIECDVAERRALEDVRSAQARLDETDRLSADASSAKSRARKALEVAALEASK